ncbi:DUF4270 domain-containing protein [Inquilinus sp. KBS0705]|nr:DUF4270 domain-containing protein [Inquilinus sp. KBS0705]
MKFSKLGLLTLLISLFILNSCKRQEGIGLGVDEENQLNGTLIADTNITVTTVPEDSVLSASAGTAPLAYFKDPALGTTEANLVIVPTFPGTASTFSLPSGTISIDSAVMVLPYAAGFYGDSLTSKYKVDVYQLGERVSNSKTYYNTYHFSHEAPLLGTKTFYARPNDSLTIAKIRADSTDTVQKVMPQIRIPISKNFINNNFFAASGTVLGSADIFQNTIRGFYLGLDKTATTGPGGIVMLSADKALVNIYYKRVNGTTTDTSMISLPAFNRIAEIKHTHTTEVQAALNGTSKTGLAYIEGLAGTRVKLSFPNIKNTFAALGSDVVLNRAELVIKVAPNSVAPYAPITRLTLYKYDIAKQRVQVQDASSTDPRAGVFGGYYVPSKGEYHFIVTAFIQDLYRGKTVDYGTFLAATAPTVTDVIGVVPDISVAQRTIAIGSNSASRIKLNIIYTKIK